MRKIANPNNAYKFVAECAPYKIQPAQLFIPGEDVHNVYLVALRGTNQSMDKTDPLGLPVCFKSFAAKPNVFYSLVKNAMLEQIPAGSEVVFIAHSLGGMISQQLGADDRLSSTYKILSIMTMGSPYVINTGKKCPLHRLADTFDVIPALFSATLIASAFIGGVAHENAGYFGNPLGAHCDSYEFSPRWRKYDCFGIPGGGRYLITE